MDLSEQSFHRFIDLIYQAVEDPRQWRVFYDQLRQAIGKGWLECNGDHITPTELGRRFTNDVIELFLDA